MTEIQMKPVPIAPPKKVSENNPRDPRILSDQQIQKRLGKDPFAIFKAISLLLLICSSAAAGDGSQVDAVSAVTFAFCCGGIVGVDMLRSRSSQPADREKIA